MSKTIAQALDMLCGCGGDPSCAECNGVGHHAKRAEIQQWLWGAETEAARQRGLAAKALEVLEEIRQSDDPEELFRSTRASLMFDSLDEMLADLHDDLRKMAVHIAVDETVIHAYRLSLDRLDSARRKRRDAERGPVVETPAPPPQPVERQACSEPGCKRDAYVNDEEGKPWCKRHAHARGLLQRDAVPDADPEPAEPLDEAGNGSPQAPGRGYRFVGGPADQRVVEVPRGETEWEVDGVAYERRGNAFHAKEGR